jgi:signal transduction histidine kinase
MGSSLDLWAQRPDGSEFPVDIKLSPLQTEEGIRVMCVVRDITEGRRAQEQIQALNKDLEQRNREVERANRLKSEFLESVSHELRTPLNAIVGFSHLLGEQREGLNEEQARFVDYISHGARHLLTLINDILDLSKIEAGRLELREEKFAVASVLEEVLVAVRPSAEAEQVHLDSQVPFDLELVADRTRFRQILFNLLSNAVKFTPSNGAVTVEAHVGDGGFQLRVSDTGIGIAPEEIDAIFEKFHQASATTKGIREGTGLGLAITKRLVELHGGRVWVESEVGSGSKFFVQLPVRGLIEQ